MQHIRPLSMQRPAEAQTFLGGLLNLLAVIQSFFSAVTLIDLFAEKKSGSS